jgi:hypothetical protein
MLCRTVTPEKFEQLEKLTNSSQARGEIKVSLEWNIDAEPEIMILINIGDHLLMVDDGFDVDIHDDSTIIKVELEQVEPAFLKRKYKPGMKRYNVEVTYVPRFKCTGYIVDDILYVNKTLLTPKLLSFEYPRDKVDHFISKLC